MICRTLQAQGTFFSNFFAKHDEMFLNSVFCVTVQISNLMGNCFLFIKASISYVRQFEEKIRQKTHAIFSTTLDFRLNFFSLKLFPEPFKVSYDLLSS